MLLGGAAGSLELYTSLMGVAYGALALALVPLQCLYEAFEGTCAIELLLPALVKAADTLDGIARGPLKAVLGPRLRRGLLAADDPNIVRAVNAFDTWLAPCAPSNTLRMKWTRGSRSSASKTKTVPVIQPPSAPEQGTTR